MERFDAVVVGAGPAGSTAAYRLAREGASVLLLERARFPRDKPCGGGLTLRAVRELPVGVDPVVEDVVETMELRFRYGRGFERSAGAPLVLMTQRRRLDQHLAEQAAAAGAELRDGASVSAPELDGEGATLSVDGTRVRGAVLVGADGANGTVARALGLGAGTTHGVALEGNVGFGELDEARYRGRAVIEIGSVPGGYGWVFPKGDHVNVGVGGWGSEGPRLRGHLERLCAAHGVALARVEALRGHRLPLRAASASPVRGRALLVGDAAGLVDPLSGDGMYEAFVSSRLAAAAILDLLAGRGATLDPYGPALARALNPLTAAGWGAKVALDRFPRLVFAVARLPVTWRVVERLLRGELAHPGLSRGAGRASMRFLYRLARLAGDPGALYRLA